MTKTQKVEPSQEDGVNKDTTVQNSRVTDPLRDSINLQRQSIQKFNKYMQSLLPEGELETFKKIGEHMYDNKHIFYSQKDTLLPETNENTIHLEESLAYIIEGLNSGLHPKFLTDDETHLVQAAYGEEWYKRWNYNSINDDPVEN